MKTIIFCSLERFPLILAVLLLMPEMAAASDHQWRPTYDMVMVWLNFIILVTVVFKYAREPIKDFLDQRKGEVLDEIERLEAEKTQILGEIESANMRTAENRQRLAKMKDRMIAQGESRKRQIVDQAKQQSAVMIDAARKKMENRIIQAQNGLKIELLDMAIEQAMAQLPTLINDGDNQRLLDDYMNRLSR